MSQAALTPAYGRDYTSKAAILADLRAGKDFVFNCLFHPEDGRYCSAADLKVGPFTVRYAQLRKVASFTKRPKKQVELDRDTGATVLGWEVA